MSDVSPEDAEQSMTSALGALPRPSAPPGWEQRVLNEIDKDHLRPRGTWLGWLWKGALAAATVGFAAWLLFFRSHPTQELAMRTEVVPAAQVVRSSSAKVGDTLRVAVTVGDAPAWDVRLYQERRLVASCASGARCGRDGAEIVLTQPGSHRVLLLAGRAIPPTHADLDQDVSGAGADVKILQSAPLTVLPFAR